MQVLGAAPSTSVVDSAPTAFRTLSEMVNDLIACSFESKLRCLQKVGHNEISSASTILSKVGMDGDGLELLVMETAADWAQWMHAICSKEQHLYIEFPPNWEVPTQVPGSPLPARPVSGAGKLRCE
jgi:hypothetical protein